MDSSTNPNVPQASGAGFIAATVILLLVIVVGAIFFWRARSDKAMPAGSDSALNQVESQSSSDDTASIESDLNATDVNNVDYDLTPSNFTAS